MYGLAQIYTGCKCGETWRVGIGQTEDTENDEIYTFHYCTVCGGDNLTEKKENGVPCMHAVTQEEHEEMMWENEPDDDF